MTGRNITLDLIRGYCIVSMVTRHIADGSILAKIIHAIPKFDGASGFVLLAGLVLGIVQSKRLNRDGLPIVLETTFRRMRDIYLAQILIIIFALTVSLLAFYAHSGSIQFHNDAIQNLYGIFLMKFVPPSGNVLRLYIILFVFAIFFYFFMERRKPLTAVSISLIIYIMTGINPEYTSFTSADGQHLGANWGRWQLLFISAMTCGWYWRTSGLECRLVADRYKLAILSSAIILSGFFVSLKLPLLFDKISLAPGRIVIAYASVVFLFCMFTIFMSFTSCQLFRPLESIGKKSLDAYVWQALVAVTVPSFFEYETNSLFAMILALAVLILCWGWSEYRLNRALRP